MTITPAQIRLAVEDFLNDIDARQVEFDWLLEDAKREFEQWLCRGKPMPFVWNDLYEHQVSEAMDRRYQTFISDRRRWAR